MYLKDPNTGQPSVTLSAFVYGFMIVTVKLLLSGVTVAGITIASFGGGEYASAIGALGCVYVLRRSTSSNGNGNGNSSNGGTN